MTYMYIQCPPLGIHVHVPVHVPVMCAIHMTHT